MARRLPIILVFLLLALLLSTWAVRNLSFQTTEQAAEVSSEDKTAKNSESHWVPIDVDSFSQTTAKEVGELEAKITTGKIDPQHLEAIERSLQVKQQTLQEYQLMDSNRDGKIDYEEFNKRAVALESKVYQLRHSKVNGKEDGLYDTNWQRLKLADFPIPSGKALRVVIEAGIYTGIRDSLLQYLDDTLLEGEYNVMFYLCNGCSKEQIKELFIAAGTAGAVFVGDLPSAWYQMQFWGLETFPIDLYYTDLDGEWGGEVECDPEGGSQRCFTTHTGDLFPEIFLGRITAPSEAEEITLINHYFEKNHQYRRGGAVLSHRSLNYIDKPWAFSGLLLSYEIGAAYTQHDLITFPSLTGRDDFLARWDDDYEHLLIYAHSNPYLHWFETTDTVVTSMDVKELKPHFFFHNVAGCTAARYTVDDYITGWYIFQESDFGLAAIGSTKAGAMTDVLKRFYKPLMEGKSFGEAFRNWYINYRYSVREGQNLGLTLIGDPTLKVIMPNEQLPPACQRPTTPEKLRGLDPGTQFFCSDYRKGILTVRNTSGEDSCFPQDTIFSVWKMSVGNSPPELVESTDGGITHIIGRPGDETREEMLSSLFLTLADGQYEYRVISRNPSGGESEPLIIPFSVTSESPLTPLLISGPKPFEKISITRPSFEIADWSVSNSCFPHDISFSIWQRAEAVRTSGWLPGVIGYSGDSYLWQVDDPLPYGQYRLIVEVRNPSGKVGSRPLVVPFSVIEKPKWVLLNGEDGE